MTERERELKEELRQVHEANRKRDEERWAEIQKNMSMIPGIKDKVEALNITVNGCDEEPEKGMKVRIDRLEQKEAYRSKIIMFLTTSTIGLFVNALWMKITGKAP